MTIGQHATRLGGKPIEPYDPGAGSISPATTAYRFYADAYGDERPPLVEQLRGYAARPEAGATTALVIGIWSGAFERAPADFLGTLVELAPRLPRLEALFVGDITYEECEISWIHQSNLGPLLAAFPGLQTLRVRGGEGLDLDPCDHPQLRALHVETGGLDRGVVRRIAGASLPNLEELVLWLGDEGYGANTGVEDLRPLLDPGRFPELRALGLCNCEYQDEVAQLVVESGVLARLRHLDLSKGTLTDAGAEALLASPDLSALESLDLHHHYLSEEMVARLQALDLDVDVGERQEPDTYGDEVHRYVQVSE